MSKEDATTQPLELKPAAVSGPALGSVVPYYSSNGSAYVAIVVFNYTNEIYDSSYDNCVDLVVFADFNSTGSPITKLTNIHVSTDKTGNTYATAF